MALQDKTAAVIGGGVAGASAALALADQGVKVTLIERGEFIGGQAARLACKAIESCQKCNGCLVEPRLAALLSHPDIEILRRSRLSDLKRSGQGFRLSLEQGPAYINPESCTGCGLCLEQCPQPGAIKAPLVPGDLPRLAIDPALCLFFKDQGATLCRDACPEEAINFSAEPGLRELEADVVIMATGFTPFPAGAIVRLGHGRVPGVVTGSELEQMLRNGGLPPERGAERVAFIQCVGSRNTTGHNYCSRVCCGYALRLGRMLHSRLGSQVSVFYMDLQSFGHAFDDFLAAADQELRLIRSMPYDVSAGPEGQVLVEYQAQPGQAPLKEAFDLLVLSVGMAPGLDNPELAQMSGLTLDQHGFLAPGEDQAGLFLAGAATGPMDVAETVAQAEDAARQALGFLEVN